MSTKTTHRQRFMARFMKDVDEFSFKQHGERKTALFAGVSGRVLEIGPGTGVNLQFFDPGVEWIGVEPNPAMHPHLVEKAEALGMKVELKTGISEELGVPDESVGTVVSTEVLCSVSDLPGTLAEIRRVLEPRGRFLFVEHVADWGCTFRRCAQAVMPFTPWRYFSDGCNPNRDIEAAIRDAGFGDVQCERYMQGGKGVVVAITRPHIAGVAVK